MIVMESVPGNRAPSSIQKYFEWRRIYDERFLGPADENTLANETVAGGIEKAYGNLFKSAFKDPKIVVGFIWPNKGTDGLRVVDKIFGHKTDGMIVKVEEVVDYPRNNGDLDYCLVMKNIDQETVYGLASEIEMYDVPPDLDKGG